MITRVKNLTIHRTPVLLILSIAAITLGGIIYILFRPVEPLFFDWIKTVGLGHELTKLRDLNLLIISGIPNWIIYSLPNGFWAFAYTILIISIWWDSNSFLKYFWLATIPILIMGYELLQIGHYLSGTFCMQDIAAGLAGIGLGILPGIKLTKNKIL